MNRPATARRPALILGGGAVVVGLASVAWGALRGEPLPQALWSNRVLQHECVNGKNERACIRACDRGVIDDGGCLGAGELAVSRPDATAAERTTFFERACRSGSIEGCRRWQRASPALALHASSGEYLAWLLPTERACDLGHAVSCWQVAGAALGVDGRRARAALARLCASKGDASKDECVRSGEQRLGAIEQRAPVCARGDAPACGELAVLALEGNNFVLAGEALGNVCALRGLDRLLGAPLVTECGPGNHFPSLPEGEKGNCAQRLVEDGEIRWRRNTFAPTAEAASEQSEEKDGDASIAPPKVALGTIEPAAMDDALRPLLTALLPSFARCHATGFAQRKAMGLPAASAMTAVFVIDRLGDPWLVNGFNLEDSDAIRCIVRQLRSLHVPPRSEVVRVQTTLRFTP